MTVDIDFTRPRISPEKEEGICENTDLMDVDLPDEPAKDLITRIFASYDMGWSKRGSGRQYDSLNGYGALIGSLSGKIIDFHTCNRKCRRCDLGHPQTDHDCRLNYYGSAKGMEPHAANILVNISQIFKEANIEIGVLVGDDDSTAISRVRENCDHEILKFSDKNHASRGVKSLLYTLSLKHKQLTSKEIDHLQRCFNYAVSQNVGNVLGMKAAICNIANHAFDIHKDCGEWCGAAAKRENYEPTITLNMTNLNLRNDVVEFFSKLGENAEKFISGFSSQPNESLNSVMAKKSPKTHCYSLSESSDFRFASAVCQKNLGEPYLIRTIATLNMSSTIFLKNHTMRKIKKSEKKSNIIKTTKFKSRRIFLKKQRNQLRHQKELSEGTTYEKNVGLKLEEKAVESENTEGLPQLSLKIEFQHDQFSIAFFDLETSGFSAEDEILQIAVKSGEKQLNQYVTPKKKISAFATKVHGLTSEGRDLFFHGKIVPSEPLRAALTKLVSFLKSLQKPAILVAHNCTFDSNKLVMAINKCGLINLFEETVEGFADSLPIFKKKFPGKDHKLLTLTKMDFAVDLQQAHDAYYDIVMLENICFKYLNVDSLIENYQNFHYVLNYKESLKSLEPLKNQISQLMIKRMATCNIKYEVLLAAYNEDPKKAIEILEQKENGKKVIRTKKIMDSILNHFQALK